jgi:hypothetical protein
VSDFLSGFLSSDSTENTAGSKYTLVSLFIFVYRLGMAYNVSSVSEVSRRKIWAEMRSTGARYALLFEVLLNIFMLILPIP